MLLEFHIVICLAVIKQKLPLKPWQMFDIIQVFCSKSCIYWLRSPLHLKLLTIFMSCAPKQCDIVTHIWHINFVLMTAWIVLEFSISDVILCFCFLMHWGTKWVSQWCSHNFSELCPERLCVKFKKVPNVFISGLNAFATLMLLMLAVRVVN